MADWSVMEREWQNNSYDAYQYSFGQFFQEEPQQCMQQPCMQQQCMQQQPMQEPMPPPPPMPPPQPPAHASLFSQPTPSLLALLNEPSTSRPYPYAPPTKPENPRELRNKAEKQRRDKLNQSIGDLASMVPPVVAASKKIDKTGVLRLTAHYLRAHQYVFGDSVNTEEPSFSLASTRALLSILNGFLLTTTYRGLIVVISQNVQDYLGYSELELLGHNVFTIIHEDDRQLMRDMLMPKPHMIGPNGELLLPDEDDASSKVAETLINEKRQFIIRFKKLGQRSEPAQYVTCHIEGSLRKSDRAGRTSSRGYQIVRRARARGENPCNSGNDVVFVGLVRVATETFMSESNIESYRMEYKTRHSIDGQIIQCDRRISLVTGYMTHEVNGINAMNFMHRDDVRWVVIALREMYDQHRLFGESCYRLLSKNGQFVYMRTRGRLDVDPNTRAVTSFVCTNTMVDEIQGKHLIKMMKKKFTLLVNNNEELPPEEETKDANDASISVEDPRQLEKVILHLVTNLPSPAPENGESPERYTPPPGRLAIIPPKKEKIVSAIEKIYNVIKSLPKGNDKERFQHGKVVENNPGVVSNALMTYEEPKTSFPQQLSIGPETECLFPQNTQSLMSPLPNFSNVYPARSYECNGPIEMSLAMYGQAHQSYDPMLPNNGLPSTCTSGAPNVIQEGFNENMIQNGYPEKNQTIKYHLSLPPTGNQNINIIHELVKPLANTVVTGIKRPRETTEYTEIQVVINKKKNGDIINKKEFTIQPTIFEEPPLFDNLFDDNVFDASLSQIDPTMNTLQQNNDPTFPELLIPQEVHDILKAIENEATGNQLSS